MMPGGSPDLFPGRAQLQSRHSLPQHKPEGSFLRLAVPPGLLLPLSLTRLCFLQQLRAEGCRAGSLRRRGGGKLGSELLLSLLDWGRAATWGGE